MKDLLNKWRFYGLEETEYKKSLESIFVRNIYSLRIINVAIAALLLGFLFDPLFINKNSTKTLFFLITSAVAALLYFLVSFECRRTINGKAVKKRFVYIFICLTYINVISLGIYLGVWGNTGNVAGAFLAILICALLLFNIPPLFHHILTLCTMIAFIVIVSIVKTPEESRIDILNVLLAGFISVVLDWYVIMTRLSLASFAKKMEDERDIYLDQSTIDDLTQLKNRRDFFNTFERVVSSYRQGDRFLCVGILDIDFFKDYNDYYGHPQGDECLRSVGKVLKDLQNKMDIYAARIGGEEFALVWFQKDPSNVYSVTSIIKEKICRLNIPHEKSEAAPYVTASIGVYVVRCGSSYDVDTLYDLADKALYTAKKRGRNRIVINFPDKLLKELVKKMA